MSARGPDLLVALTLLGLVAATGLDLPGRLGLLAPTEPMLALALGAAALTVARGRGGSDAAGARGRTALVVAALALAAAACLAVPAQGLLAAPPAWLVGVAAALLGALGLAVQAAFGPVLPVIALALALFVAFAAPALPSAWRLAEVDASRLLVFLVFDGNALFGRLLDLALHTIAPFVLLGVALKELGGLRGLVAAVVSHVRVLPGGAAKAAILASATFGTLSGSAVANVATAGAVTIPAMIRAGHSPEEAAGIEGTASTGGQLTPPMLGATAFLIADTLGIPYARVAAASVVPAILYFAALLLAVDLAARRRGAMPAPSPVASRRRSAVRPAELGGSVAAILLLLWLLFVAPAPPGEAALAATAPVVLGAVLARPARARRRLARTAVEAACSIAGLLLLAAASTVLLGLLAVNGLGSLLSLRLAAMAQYGALALLVASAALALLLGLGLPTLGVYVLMAGIAAPALAEAGIPPLAAHLFLTWFGVLAMVTPPVALATYAAAAIAGCSAWRAALATLPLWPGLIVPPFAFALAPALLDPASPLRLLAALGPAVLALALITAATIGRASGPLLVSERVLAAGGGLAALVALAPGLPSLAPTALIAVAALCAGWLFHPRRSSRLIRPDIARRSA
ncbi:MAG: TRAP transporter fused permease subunit [Elioraea sp.]|nr:TRAP transporter fused permease subunit [Elioraea sp.]